MRFDLEQAVEVLSATPGTLRSLLGRLSADSISDTTPSDDHPVREARSPLLKSGGELRTEWRAYDVVGHLIHGEETDWIPRARIIIEQGADRTFEAFDRFAQFERSRGKPLGDLLAEFSERRTESLETLRAWNLNAEHLDLRGIHPELGEVTLRQLLATWVVHDLNHIRQIVTAMASRYDGDVGPWREYLSILK
ncbi:MAG: DinB family protein [Saprospiraceae bacterium]|nr:DinB family protein [Pyrinomonadaceae bacterium]